MSSITHVVNASDNTLAAEYSYDACLSRTEERGREGRMRNITTWANYAPGSEPSLFIAGRGFTGHEHLPWFNLINMNGRVYDPLVGQFLSPDNHIQDPYYTQSLNRYSYCLNNPLKFTDPSGYTLYDLMYQSYYGHLNSWIGGGNHNIQSAGYRSSRVITSGDINSLWNSPHGGRWDEYSGLTYFNSEVEALFAGCIYNEYHNSWGSTHAGNFIGALASYKNIKSNGGIGGATNIGGTVAGVDDLLALIDDIGLVAGTPWIDGANKEYDNGVAEMPEDAHNPRIIEYLESTGLSGDYLKDETGWCAAFVHWCLKQADIKGAGARPHDYDSWGQSLDGPAFGALAIFKTSHIGFVIGQFGVNLIILHGNWSNRISLSNYIKPGEIQYYRYPAGYMYKLY